MPSTCEYYKIEEKERRIDDSNDGVSQSFYLGKCNHEKCDSQAVGCNGMIELCQITDIGGKD